MANPPPEKNWYDNFLPFTTDAETAIDQYYQQAQQNQQIYDQYHQSSTAIAQGLQTDYGHLPDAQDAQGSSFTVDNPQQGQSGTQDYKGPGSTSHDGGPSRRQTAANHSLPATSAHPVSGIGSPSSYPTPSTTGYNNLTNTSGYNPGGGNANYQSNSFGPGSFGPTGGNDPSRAMPTECGRVAALCLRQGVGMGRVWQAASGYRSGR
jgi:hypothetical protein